MSIEQGILDDIISHPEVDTPRLVFADWLDEHGDSARAEFIRAQVCLGKSRRSSPPWDLEPLTSIGWGSPGTWRDPADSPEQRELAFRCRRLLDAHEGAWLSPLGGLLKREWAWSRGFVEVVDADPASLAAAGKEAFALHPIRRLILGGLEGKTDALSLIPADNRLLALDLILDGLRLESLEELASSPHLGGLTELNLMLNRLTDGAIGFLCNESFFQRLSVLRLAGNQFTDVGRQRLREHFGARVNFEGERHPERLFTLLDPVGPCVPWATPGEEVQDRAGLGNGHTQVFLQSHQGSFTLLVFDHLGNLLEARGLWDEGEGQPGKQKALLAEPGFSPARIRVKRFPGVYDFPKGWYFLFDSPDAEPVDYESAHEHLERWLADDCVRYGSYLGGVYLNRKTGERVSPR
jgi:uncharacterized protein (TIGR02996 family)